MLPYLLAAVGVIAAFGAYVRGIPARELAERERAWGGSIRPGDVVFQDLECGPRCAMIREVTQSRYAHVGVVMGDGDARVVWEAFGPVGPTPLVDWVERGVDRRVAVYRPNGELARLRLEVERRIVALRGRPYDSDYQWDDARIYCSELVAKPYRDVLGYDLIAPHPVSLGSLASRVAAMSHGRLTSATLLVTPADLVASGAFERVVDELAATRRDEDAEPPRERDDHDSAELGLREPSLTQEQPP